MTEGEYATIAETIHRSHPRAMLVFGCGRDSSLWCDLKPASGLILFVESDAKWAALCPAPVLTAHYSGTVSEALTRDPLSTIDCWQTLASTQWDMVIVDGPRGDSPGAPGRLGPIAFASACRGPVLVHDTHRPVEKALVARYFPNRLVRQIHHLTIIDPID